LAAASLRSVGKGALRAVPTTFPELSGV